MKFVLDYNRLYALEADYAKDVWRIRFHLPEGTYSSFANHLFALITLKTDDEKIHTIESINMDSSCSRRLEIYVDGHLFGEIRSAGNGELEATHKDFLTVTETRLIGEMPGGKGAVHKMRGDGSAEGVIFTDFHTHSSSEISGQDLVALAMETDASYPVRLLTEIGIAPVQHTAREVPRIWFPPLEPDPSHIPKTEAAVPVSVLSEHERVQLANAFNVRADRQSTTGEMELDYYRLRYPLAKHPEIFRALWHKIAIQYRRHGIHYAEITISTPSAEQLALLHEELPRIEEETGVRLRFLVGMPRTLPRNQLHGIIEKAKILSASPFIVGLDFIGYEVNKTKDFDEELRSLAEWIREENPEFTLRVHAGENAKNLENVHDVLAVAHEYGIRTRIGHAVYGVHDRATMSLAQRLSKKGKLVLEFNVDSNLALNNIDAFYAIPFHDYVRKNIAFLISSDGNGFYQTCARQLEKDLEHIGLGADALDAIRHTQQVLVLRQVAYSDEKRIALMREAAEMSYTQALRWQAAELSRRCAEVIIAPTEKAPTITVSPPPGMLLDTEGKGDALPEILGERKPVLLFGASGASWRRIKPSQQAEAAIAVDMLARALDPQKIFFVLGRAKNAGLSAKLEQALESMREEDGKASFYVMSLMTPHAISDPENISVRLNFIQPIEDNFVALARRLVEFIKRHEGRMIGIGGAAFSRDVILKARHEGVGFTVMSEVDGASREKAFMLEPHRRAKNPIQLLRRLYEQHPDWFLPGAMDSLEELYAGSQRRVERRNGRRAMVHDGTVNHTLSS